MSNHACSHTSHTAHGGAANAVDFPQKLLVVRLGALGDLLHLSAALAWLHQIHPHTQIHLLTSPLYQPLAEGFEGVSQVWSFSKGRHGLETWQRLHQLAKALRAAGIDGMVNLHPNLKFWLLQRWVLGWRRGWGKTAARTYHKQKLTVFGQGQRQLARRHAVEDFAVPFAQLFGLPQPQLGQLIPNLALPDGPTNDAQAHWIGIIPGVGGKRGNRAWLPQAYVALINRLHQHCAESQVLLIGGPDETALAETIVQEAQHPHRIQNHCGPQSFWQTARRLAQCRVVVGGDTGPLHLAAAVGTPIVCLYGPTSLKRTGPLGRQAIHTLLPPESLSCWPCEKPTCRYSGDDHLACMKQISPEQVAAAVEPWMTPKSPAL